MKKWLHGIIVCLLGVIVLGGCQTMPKITKEQQNNVATRILRSYDVQEIEFIRFTQDAKTGSYLLSVKINNDDDKKITLSSPNYDELNKNTGWIGLDPISKFKDFEKDLKLSEDEEVDLSTVKIKYLGE